jgi:o-succinylbenzoate synthase
MLLKDIDLKPSDIQIDVQPYDLEFLFDAKTSAGSLGKQKRVWFIKLIHGNQMGVGEIAPLKHLSPECKSGGISILIEEAVERFGALQKLEHIYHDPAFQHPSILFGFETAIFSLKATQTDILFKNDFTAGKSSITINGLVWIASNNKMRQEALYKAANGYKVVKIKIGSQSWPDDLKLIQDLRAQFPKITIRLDANGAFDPERALEKLKVLSAFRIHSIEQPIAPGLWQKMHELISQSPIPIALDEELIGIKSVKEKAQLLQALKPHYIILKPTLVGGLKHTAEWIEEAGIRNIGWWLTSALESNIGLNAIAQFVANYDPGLPQGLGTGGLYSNNVSSKLTLKGDQLYFVKAID